MNFFPADDARHEDWKQHWVRVEDGGNWYWRIEYNIDTGSYGASDGDGDVYPRGE